jgi:hypothetical protein
METEVEKRIYLYQIGIKEEWVINKIHLTLLPECMNLQIKLVKGYLIQLNLQITENRTRIK